MNTSNIQTIYNFLTSKTEEFKYSDEFKKCINILEQEIIKNNQKKYNQSIDKKRIKNLKSLTGKSDKKTSLNTNIFHKENRDGNIFYNITDGYRFYSLLDNYGYRFIKAEEDNIFTNPNEYLFNKHKTEYLKHKFDINELEMIILKNKTNKEFKKCPIYRIIRSDGLVQLVNIFYLLEFLSIFETDTLFLNEDVLSPLYYINEKGEQGVLLPMKDKNI